VLSEKRRHPRKVVRLAVAFQVKDGPRVDAFSRDMSIGGMFIVTDNQAPFNASVNLYMHLPGVKQEVTVKATVRWSEPDGFGVQFGLMGARETHALMQLLTGAPPSIR
jgi:Tfp pilus assembly protein PilZ